MGSKVVELIINYIEKIREDCLSKNRIYRPKEKEKIKLLIIGESPPINGNYFYSYDENKKIITTRKRVSSQVFRALGLEGVTYKQAYQFLMDKGFYLMDLCDYSINFLSEEVKVNIIKSRINEFFESEFNQVKRLLAKDCEKILFLPQKTLKTMEREGLLEKLVELIGQDVKIIEFSGLEDELKRSKVIEKMKSDC